MKGDGQNSLNREVKLDYDRCYETILRNKSSFISLLSTDKFITNQIKTVESGGLCKRVVRYICYRLESWLRCFTIRRNNNQITAIDLALYDASLSMDIIGDDEDYEYDVDNIVIW